MFETQRLQWIEFNLIKAGIVAFQEVLDFYNWVAWPFKRLNSLFLHNYKFRLLYKQTYLIGQQNFPFAGGWIYKRISGFFQIKVEPTSYLC